MNTTTDKDREVYVKEVETKPADDSGAGWAVALIVLILAIGFGFVAFSNNQAMNNMQTEQSLDQLRRDTLNTVPPVVPPSSNSVDVNVPTPNIEIPKVEVPKVETPKVDVNVTPAPSEPATPDNTLE